MKIVIALLTVFFGVLLALGSVLIGALMLSSANGPTPANWIAHYVLVYAVPIAIILISIFILVRLFR